MFDELRAAIADSWDSFCALSHMQQRSVVGIVVATIAITFIVWKFMLPVWLFAIAVVFYLKRKSNKGEL